MSDSLTDSSDSRRLLDDLSEGSTKTFDALFARHRSYIRQVIDMRLDGALRRRVDASDIIQETHLAMLRRLDDFLRRRPVTFRAWMRQVAQERLVMARRRHLGAQRRGVGREVGLPDRSSQQLIDQLPVTHTTASQSVSRREIARLLRQLIAEMDEPDREILLMRYIEGLNNVEIAFVLKMEANTVSKRHGRALRRLRQMLAEHDWSPEP
jgi:RNA polymerase sigma-70 factor (ECF subfamily)